MAVNIVERTMALIERQNDAKLLAIIIENISEHKDLAEGDRARLLEAAGSKVRKISPKIAKSLLGPKDAKAENFLSDVLAEMGAAYDLSGNKLEKNSVKVGGEQMDGTKYVNRYVAYKSFDNLSLTIQWDQDTISDMPYILVRLRKVEGKGSTPLLEMRFDSEDEARQLYLSELGKIVEK